MAVRNSDRYAVRGSRRGRPWRQKYGLDLRPHCGPKTRPHYGPLISGPLQNNDLGAQIEDRIAVPNQDRVFDSRGAPVATTLPRIPGRRGHQKAARSRPHCGLKSKPFFRWLGRPAATAWLWVSYQTPSNRGWRCLLRPLLSHLLPCLALPLLRLLLSRRCSRQRLALQDRWRPRCLQHLPRAPRQALWHTF